MTLAIKKPCLCKEKSIGHAGGGLPKKGIQLIRNKCSCNSAGPIADSTGNTTPSKEHLFIALPKEYSKDPPSPGYWMIKPRLQVEEEGLRAQRYWRESSRSPHLDAQESNK